MKCRICGLECPPGAKLCRDCAAARKRAFAATVTQPLLVAAGAPSVGRPRFAPRPERRRSASSRKPAAATAARSEAVMAASAADGTATATARRPIGVQWLLLALAVACAIVYLLIRVLFAHHGAPSGDAVAPSDTASEVAAPAAAAPAEGALLPGGPSADAAGAPPDNAKADAANALKNAAKAGRHKPKAEVPVIALTLPPPPPPEPVPTPRAPPPPVVEAPRDPWQAMNDGLSRCALEDVIHRGACEQRLRLQYCPGHWGVVWQCPIGPPLDTGR